MRRLLILLLSVLFFSCQEEVDLPLATIEGEIPVIEGTWTDKDFYNEVTISLAKNYFDESPRIVISDAEVVISIPGTEVLIPFVYNSSTGSYRPKDRRKVAKVGERYTLSVKWRDNIYQASGLMLEAPKIDSLTYEFKEKRLFSDEGYYIKAYGKIPFSRDNYYRIRVIENDTLKNNREDYLLFDDTFGLSFFERGLELNYAFQPGDRVRLELFRMNRDVYNYFTQLVGLLFNDGGLFSPPPQNPETNIRVIQGEGEVLGYFLVSPLLSESIFIRE
ncbi:DUF4249 family protein [Algoriphagus algorifonticola]|uniref:DUF4249 family protein n=1 Tax=Algoriphagus algorifonticola TaxID=2593007 RepID=UPI00164298D3|nr:DUF4249 family protein [Algoriphagus algorifonticola]